MLEVGEACRPGRGARLPRPRPILGLAELDLLALQSAPYRILPRGDVQGDLPDVVRVWERPGQRLIARKPVQHLPHGRAVPRPAFEGAQISYSWQQLEQGKDQYDFSFIREDLLLLTAHGKKLWFQFDEVTFNPNRINLPKYLLTDVQHTLFDR